jgi:Ca-activated chloride channel family protein
MAENKTPPASSTLPLTLDCTLASSIVPITGQPRLVYLLVDVSGGEGAHTLPSNLGFILDTSDSMRIRLVTDEQFMQLARNGQAQEVMTDGVPAYQIKSVSSDLLSKFPRRIDYVSDALKIASEYLRAVDQFSVVAFAERAQCMIPSVSGKEKVRLHQAARELEYMRLGDETHMAQGIAMAFAEVQSQCGGACASRLILLTDGHTRNVKECYDWAQTARKAGIKLTTMGIGVEFNEELLIPLADITGGNAYYIETPEQIPDAFRRELGAALNISYRNVEVKLLLPAGVVLRRMYRVLPDISTAVDYTAFDPGANLSASLDAAPGAAAKAIAYSVSLGDYDPTAPQALLLELVIPPWPAGNYRLAQVLLAWDDPRQWSGTQSDTPSGALGRLNLRKEVHVRMSDMATAPLEGRVMNIIEKVGAFKMGTQALEVAEKASKTTSQNEKASATLRLRQAATRLLDMGEAALADTMFRQAETLERSGSLDPDATKRLRYETRRMTQRL